MRQNIGSGDQSIRIVASVFMIVVAATFAGPATLLGIAGILLLLTANFGLCPVYLLIGINTLHEDEALAVRSSTRKTLP